MIKMICFDMDGTIYNFYEVENWLEKLRAEDVSPYLDGGDLCDMAELVRLCNELRSHGVEIRVISHLAGGNPSPAYNEAVRKAKREWLESKGFPADKIHLRKYGSPKADAIRADLKRNPGEAVLFDDNPAVRKSWTLGPAINPETVDIINFLSGILEKMC